MSYIGKLVFHIIEALTIDYIPMYFNRYYVFNSDKSGFLMPSKHSPSDNEIVYYPADVDSDIYKVREKYVSENYKSSLITSTLAHLVAVASILLVSPGVFTGIILYLVVAVVAKFAFTLVEGVHLVAANKRVAGPDYLHLSVVGGLGVKSGMADRSHAILFRDSLKGADNLSPADRLKINSESIRVRSFS